MDAEAWLIKLAKFIEQSDWEALSELRRSTNQAFASNMDHDGLQVFYDKVIRTGLDDSKHDDVKILSTEKYQSELAEAFRLAKGKIPALNGVKGVYFEYFFDGGDSCTGNLFLCTEYSDNNDFWGSEFEKDGFIAGPSVFEFLNFDPEFEWENLPRFVGEEYVNGVLLALCCEIQGLPFGFANHDQEMVRAPAN